uniref:Helicase C-terminal domain-containing protein n=1 Tax=Steinernema glaseri TaxID=37863 RepID=A0A1I7XYS6_9BILA
MLRRPKNGGPMTAVQNPFLFNSQNSIAKSRDNFQRMNCILVVLLKLRQACVHLALTKAHIDLDAFDTLGVENDPTADLNRELAEMSIAGDELINQVAASSGDVSEQVEALFEERYKSAKVKALLTELDKVLELGDKCVIVSQWTSMLNIVERHLKKREAPYTSITGAVPTKDRQSRVDSFNLPDGEGAQVMLLSLTAGGVGLNLIGGNHLFLLDLHWNPALENQACDRIYRMGQKKNVYIHKFICKDTIEQRVLELQKKKLELAHGVLDGAASKKLTKLNINDLKFLFDLNKPTEP